MIMKEYVLPIVIGVLQGIVSVVVSLAMLKNITIMIVLVVVDVFAIVGLFLYFRNKLKAKEKLLDLYKNVGIDGCTEKLQGTSFEPQQCMSIVSKYLDFMGVGGNKWVDQDNKQDLLINMLKRVKAAKGRVRFLLIDPRSDGYKRLKELRKDKVPRDSYKRFQKLVKEYECLEVHLYDDLPSFRLQFVDQEYVAISRYYIEHELHAKKEFGWKNPHLIVRAEKIGDIQKGETQYQGSLYKSFEQLYEYIWTHSADLKYINLKAVFGDDY